MVAFVLSQRNHSLRQLILNHYHDRLRYHFVYPKSHSVCISFHSPLSIPPKSNHPSLAGS